MNEHRDLLRRTIHWMCRGCCVSQCWKPYSTEVTSLLVTPVSANCSEGRVFPIERKVRVHSVGWNGALGRLLLGILHPLQRHQATQGTECVDVGEKRTEVSAALKPRRSPDLLASSPNNMLNEDPGQTPLG